MGWSDEDLNEAGYIQARRLALRLGGLPITLVYCSPLPRAYTTAAILAEPHTVKPKALDELIEIRLGDWQGLHVDEIKRRWPQLWRKWRISPAKVNIPNGESISQVAERVIRAFDRIVAGNPGKQAAIVTHEVAVKVLVAHILGVSSSIYRRFEISNASLTVIRVINGSSHLTMLNDTSHLGG
jgi:broad specificity phosphatase PhoE